MKTLVLTLATVLAIHAAPELGIEKSDLYSAGTGGYAVFRIPGIVTTAKGTVLAYAEARRSERGDWNATDIVLRRGTKGGRLWSAFQTIARVEGAVEKNPVALAQKLATAGEVTYNNPVAISSRDGTVHFVFCLEYMRAFYMRSIDDGVTWTKPVEITQAFEGFRAAYDWKVLATGPGHGIEMSNGRLLIPVWLSLGTGGHAHRPSVAATIYSDDRGKTWKSGQIALPNTPEFLIPNETAAVELADGRVMLNARSESTAHRRIVTVSNDGATGWSAPVFDPALLEPICMGSLVRYSTEERGARNRLLFSNPYSADRQDGRKEPGMPRDRKNLSVQLSYDEGRTWPVRKAVEPGWSGYSDLAVLADGAILLLYERGEPSGARFRADTLTLARIRLGWLTDGKDPGARK